TELRGRLIIGELLRLCGCVAGNQCRQLRDSMVVVTEIRLARIVSPTSLKRPIGKRRGPAPGCAAVIRIEETDFSQITTRINALIEIEDVHPPRRFIYTDKREPLRTDIVGAAIVRNSGTERQVSIGSSQK